MLPWENPYIVPDKLEPVAVTVIGIQTPVLPDPIGMILLLPAPSKKSRVAAPGPT
jgi:hypothetical protein